MSAWITVYCADSLRTLTASQLLDGIRGKDAYALAGVDYPTLAEDYGAEASHATDLARTLAVRALDNDAGYEVTYRDDSRPVFLRQWRKPDRVAEEVREVTERPEQLPQQVVDLLSKTQEVVGVEYAPQSSDEMGIVVAYEVARYVAQVGAGIIRTDEGRWLRVLNGGFSELR